MNIETKFMVLSFGLIFVTFAASAIMIYIGLRIDEILALLERHHRRLCDLELKIHNMETRS